MNWGRAKSFTLIFLSLASLAVAEIPRPLPDHPGNIFVEGEAVSVAAPPGEGEVIVTDYDGNKKPAELKDGRVELGPLPIGYYELRRGESNPRITLGVIAPRKAQTPDTSPMGIDVAMAWFYKDEKKQRAAANLCRIAGMNWVRDRIAWGEMEPERDKFVKHNIYDDTARIQTEAGLKVLQVNHHSPPWAGKDGRRFPEDLRDAYNFYRELASRWKGKVLAIEPWNEADIDVFGGHTGAEMASMQKVSYFGLKAGNPDVIACQNVFAIARTQTLDDFNDNEVSPYYDTYNLHHYVPFAKYAEEYGRHRPISRGKPMWTTECNVTVHWADEKTKEPDDKSLRWQANRVAKVYSLALHEGSVNVFYFILGHYVERTLQYGIVHEDLTPRPAFVALAAAGRFLCDARPLGAFDAGDGATKGYLFNTSVDGERKVVMVIWGNDTPREIAFDKPIEAVFDQLGRKKKERQPGKLRLTGAPIYVVMKHHAVQMPDQPRPTIDMALGVPRNPIVFQALMPVESIALKESAYVLPPAQKHELTLFAYNFGDVAAQVLLEIDPPPGWKVTAHPSTVVIDKGGRAPFTLTIEPRNPKPGIHKLRVRGLGAMLSMKLLDEKPAENPQK